jgi:hypothetical protein
MRQLLEKEPFHTRVKGRPALMKRLRALLVAVHRFARARARTPDDVQWAARTIAALSALLQED